MNLAKNDHKALSSDYPSERVKKQEMAVAQYFASSRNNVSIVSLVKN